VKHVLRYLRGTSQYGLWYRRTEGVKLQGFTDENFPRSPSYQKSTLGGIFNLGLVAVSWYSRKRRSVTLSSTEAEYMATGQAACEAIWMQKILVGLLDQRMDPTVIYCDNQSCINSLRIHYFMTGPSTPISGIIIFETMWLRGSCCCNMFRPRSRTVIF